MYYKILFRIEKYICYFIQILNISSNFNQHYTRTYLTELSVLLCLCIYLSDDDDDDDVDDDLVEVEIYRRNVGTNGYLL